MYVPGNVGNFSTRIHQLPRTIADVDDFIAEGDTYLSSVTINLSGKWERELRKRKYLISNNGAYLSAPQLGLGGGGTTYILDTSDSQILDISNAALEGV